jgi:hypothetical protein
LAAESVSGGVVPVVSVTSSHGPKPKSKYTLVLPAFSTCVNVIVEPAGSTLPKSNTVEVCVLVTLRVTLTADERTANVYSRKTSVIVLLPGVLVSAEA